MKFAHGILVGGWILTWIGAVVAGPLLVVSPDGPLPCVVAGSGTASENAATDLCDYLSRLAARDIKPAAASAAGGGVTIHVGADAFALEHAPEINDLYADGFVIKHVEDQGKHHLILAGKRWWSSHWAVQEFLKQFCGVRWLFPYDHVYGEIVPSMPTISVPAELNQRHEPDYLDRSNLAMYFYNDQQTFLRLRASGGMWFGSHEFQNIFTREDYEAHPDWFALFTIPQSWAGSILDKKTAASKSVVDALSGGVQRQRWHWDYGSDWQICTSNPATVHHAVEYARKYFDQNPDAPVVSMGHNDNSGWCECDECVKLANSVNPPYTISERYWLWVNQVARELARTHPDKKITTLAYGEPAAPPRFELEKNITVMVTVYVEGHLDLVKRWQAKSSSVSLYTYMYGFFFLGFRHYPHAARDFLKWGHDDLGALSLVAECSGNWSFDGPKYHYMQALMWDVNADPDTIMDEYCHDWFGAAAGPMRAFWDRHEEIYERRGSGRRWMFYQWVGFSPNYDEFDLFTTDDVSALDESIAQAEQAADTDADRFRVARVADAWRYFRALLLSKLNFADREGQVLSDAATSLDRAVELSRQLARLQGQMEQSLEQLRAFPHVNPHVASDVYFSTYSRVSAFADMRSILDQLCSRLTEHLTNNQGGEAAIAFWKDLPPTDPLSSASATQLYLLAHAARPSVLVNGDLETGDLKGWEIAGEIAIDSTWARSGRFAAIGSGTLKQSIPVKPGEQYRLTVWGKYPTPPLPNVPLFGVDVSYEGGGKDRYPEVTYRRLRPSTPPAANEWMSLQTTFTIAPDVDQAVISLNPTRSSDLPVIWDDIVLERIR